MGGGLHPGKAPPLQLKALKSNLKQAHTCGRRITAKEGREWVKEAPDVGKTTSLGLAGVCARFGKPTDGVSFSLYLDQITGPMRALHLIFNWRWHVW